MSRLSLIALILAGLTPAPLTAQQAGADDDARLVKVFDGYQELLADPPEGAAEDRAGEAWYILVQAINAGSMRFTVDPAIRGLPRAARFYATADDPISHIIVSRDLLDIWDTNPSTAYGVITAAVIEAAEFFRDPPAWGASRSRPLARLLTDIEGYAAQAELIRDRLLPRGFLLSPYDTFILDSYEGDGLAGVVLFVNRFSLPAALALYEAANSYEESGDTDALRETVLSLGSAVLGERDGAASEIEEFQAAAAVHSWLEFTPDIVSRIHNKNRRSNPLAFDRVLSRESDYSNLRRLLEARRTADMPLILKRAAEMDRRFGIPEE